ncbi:MAG: hypothetical protein RLZZ546_212 [Bacteroidota bacterium]
MDLYGVLMLIVEKGLFFDLVIKKTPGVLKRILLNDFYIFFVISFLYLFNKALVMPRLAFDESTAR